MGDKAIFCQHGLLGNYKHITFFYLACLDKQAFSLSLLAYALLQF